MLTGIVQVVRDINIAEAILNLLHHAKCRTANAKVMLAIQVLGQDCSHEKGHVKRGMLSKVYFSFRCKIAAGPMTQPMARECKLLRIASFCAICL